jgi:ribose/xylose/arabinose/galactoside ABC-type transport system permease subunit
MKDIAIRANTSINTVSKALRNHPQVSKKKKQEILEIVREMGYIPNITARTLRQQRSYLLGMVVGDNTNPYFATMIKTVQMKLKEHNYSLVTFNNYENIEDELRFVTELCGLRVAGVLLSPAMGNSLSAELLKKNNIPYVFINRAPENTLDPYVMADDELAAYLATKHLIDNKKGKILFMNFYEGFITSKMRGSIDLSAGSMIALTGVVAVKAYVATNNLILAILAAMAISLLCYFVIVIAHTQLEVPTFICSLGMLSIARAVVTMISSGTITMLPYDSPFKKIFGLRPSILIVGFALFVFALIIEKYTLFGRYTRLIGGDEIVARLSGIDVNKRKIMVYLFAGIMTAIGGVIMAARIGSGSPSIGDGYELNVISAVVLGGTSQRGGIGGVRGTLIGALTLTMLANGLVLWGMPSEVQLLIKGAVLVLAVFISQERGTGAVVK